MYIINVFYNSVLVHTFLLKIALLQFVVVDKA